MHTATYSFQRGRVRVVCSCGESLGKHDTFKDAIDAHTEHTLNQRIVSLAEQYNSRR